MFLKLFSLSHYLGQQKGQNLTWSLLSDFTLLALCFPLLHCSMNHKIILVGKDQKPTFNLCIHMGITEIFLPDLETWKRRLRVCTACCLIFVTFLPSLLNDKYWSQLESPCRAPNELVTTTKHLEHQEALPVVWNSYHLPRLPRGFFHSGYHLL